ncbi:unnamed protein product [Candida verbasci]|uniref:Uncharacterized protein n=1 Tax=Candida verbasci TaxID=1227364 RepID=A0A9W4TR63_9ASCO|nr:unnamed protein product [Candida verbasci]
MIYYLLALLLIPISFYSSAFIKNITGSNSGLLYTNLDDNTVCYVQIYGVGFDGHKKDSDFKWGVAKDLYTSPELVISSVQYMDQLLTNDQVHEFTETVDHLPNYDEKMDYCQEFKEKVEFWSDTKHKARHVSHVEPAEPNLFLRIINYFIAIFTTID